MDKLTSRRDRTDRQEREDQHILPEMDEPGPEQSAGFEHRFAQQPISRWAIPIKPFDWLPATAENHETDALSRSRFD